MPETLLSPSNILLYGRELLDIEITPPKKLGSKKVPPSYEQRPHGSGVTVGPDPKDSSKFVSAPPLEPPDAPPRLGENNFLRSQLDAGVSGGGTIDLNESARLARIYAFSYEGHYYDLAKPAIFLVHGPGSDPEAFRPAPSLPRARVSRAPADADRTGIAYTASSFSEDMRVWTYDTGDYSLRFDTMSGTLEDILLNAELCGGGAYGGSNAFGGGSNAFGGGSNAFGGGSNAFGGGSNAFGGGSNARRRGRNSD